MFGGFENTTYLRLWRREISAKFIWSYTLITSYGENATAQNQNDSIRHTQPHKFPSEQQRTRIITPLDIESSAFEYIKWRINEHNERENLELTRTPITIMLSGRRHLTAMNNNERQQLISVAPKWKRWIHSSTMCVCATKQRWRLLLVDVSRCFRGKDLFSIQMLVDPFWGILDLFEILDWKFKIYKSKYVYYQTFQCNHI